jgi:hypothetical protein
MPVPNHVPVLNDRTDRMNQSNGEAARPVRAASAKSATLNAAGLVLLLLPCGVFTLGLALQPPGRAAAGLADLTAVDAIAFAGLLAAMAVSSVVGFAVMRRWPRWRSRGGLAAYVLVCVYGVALIALPQFVWDIEALRPGLIVWTSVLGIFGIYSFIAIHEDHPSDARWRTLAGGLMIMLFSFVFLAGGMFVIDEVPEDVGLGLLGALLIAAGLKVTRRFWHAHSGSIACGAIALGGVMFVSPFMTGLPWRAAWPLMLNRAEPALLLVVTGCFIVCRYRRKRS